jgi:hypothetical protein
MAWSWRGCNGERWSRSLVVCRTPPYCAAAHLWMVLTTRRRGRRRVECRRLGFHAAAFRRLRLAYHDRGGRPTASPHRPAAHAAPQLSAAVPPPPATMPVLQRLLQRCVWNRFGACDGDGASTYGEQRSRCCRFCTTRTTTTIRWRCPLQHQN